MRISRPIFILFFLSFSFFISAPAYSKALKSIEETEALSDTVTEMFMENHVAAAFDLLEKYWPLPQNEIDNLKEQSIKMLNTVSDRFGDVIGYQRIRKEAIADIATRETYFLRFENTAMRLIFTYYRNDRGWILNAFKWDDSFTEEFRDVD